jgi:hypothetical protein
MPERTTMHITSDIGPAIVYCHSDRGSVTAVDRQAPTDPRERAICRSLLVLALALIDAEDANPQIHLAVPAAAGEGR